MASGIKLEGQHIFVVGGSRGIGAATARALGSFSAQVSLTYQSSRSAAVEVVENIQSEGGQASAFQVDIEDEASVLNAVDDAVAQFGDLKGMVVSAGVFEHCLIEEMTVDFWERSMSINLRGTVWCVKAAARHMRTHGNGGSIVIFSSTAGQAGGGGGAPGSDL